METVRYEISKLENPFATTSSSANTADVTATATATAAFTSY